MKHIIESWDEKIYESALLDYYFNGMKLGILDIETTGLNPARNKFVLGGLYDVSAGLLHQVLAESREEEALALAEYLQLIDDMDVVVTYNGRHFDIPFLERRWRNCGRYVPAVYNLDLYQVVDKHSQLRRLLPNLKQKTLEEYMGFWMNREDMISGAESVDLFNHYEATGDPETEKKILLHNNDDVRQLTRLTKVATKCDFHKAMFNIGFPVKCGEHLLKVRKIRINRKGLQVEGLQLKNPVEYIGFEFNGQAIESRFHGREFEFAASMSLCHGHEKQDDIDYRQINRFVKEFLKLLFEREIEL